MRSHASWTCASRIPNSLAGEQEPLRVDRGAADGAGLAALFVSNSLSGRHWELDQVPAVGDRTDIVQLGTGHPCVRRRRSTACGPSTTRGCVPRCRRGQTPGATQRCLNPGFSERIWNSRRTGGRDRATSWGSLGCPKRPSRTWLVLKSAGYVNALKSDHLSRKGLICGSRKAVWKESARRGRRPPWRSR